MADTYIRQFFIQLARHVAVRRTATRDASDDMPDVPIQVLALNKALDYIHSNLNRPLRVQDIAEACGYSEAHVSRLFREHVGMTPSDYVAKARIDLAKQLLLTGQFGVSDVAAQVGFSDPFYFSRLFKSVVSVSPRQFIKTQGAG